MFYLKQQKSENKSGAQECRGSIYNYRHQWALNPDEKGGAGHLRAVSYVTLTAVFLITPIRTVTEAVAAETSDDAVDAVGTREKCRGAL